MRMLPTVTLIKLPTVQLAQIVPIRIALHATMIITLRPELLVAMIIHVMHAPALDFISMAVIVKNAPLHLIAQHVMLLAHVLLVLVDMEHQRFLQLMIRWLAVLVVTPLVIHALALEHQHAHLAKQATHWLAMHAQNAK